MAVKEMPTDNIYLAAYLHIEKIPILRIERSGRFGTFYFPEDKAHDKTLCFFSKTALVEPEAYSSAVRELRQLVDRVATISPPAGCHPVGGN